MNEAISTDRELSPAPLAWFRHDVRSIGRAQGCMLGQIAGDSLGALVEFKTKAEIAQLYPEGLQDLASGGPWNIIAGQVTDDSELAIILARTLVKDQAFDARSVFEAYVGWRESQPFDMGGTTLRALSTPFRHRDHIDKTSQANGSLMRVSPIGLFAGGDPKRAAVLAVEDCKLTHPHQVCVSACAAFAAAIATGVTGGSRADMMLAADENAGTGVGADTIRTTLRLATSAAPIEFQHQMGWVLIAFQNAFHHLVAGSTVEHAITNTVAQGGDTDTNGAIVGALVGAAEGLRHIPPQWITSICSCRPDRSRGVPQPRPEVYWPVDCMDLARTLLATG